MICCITGMHRSGTSLTSSWLQACGLVIADGPVIPPLPDNPKGFFEDVDFVKLHAQSIRRRQRWSYGWKITPTHSLEFSPPEESVAAQLIAVRQSKYHIWGWKDPRSTLFLAYWKRLIPSLKVILVWRPAEEVAFSLLSRWRQQPSRRAWVKPWGALHMWRAYNKLACEYAEAQRQDTLVLPISYLIENDHTVLARLNEQFDAHLTYVPIRDLYDAELMHGAQTPRWLKWLSTFAGCSMIEQRLQRLFKEPR